MRILFTFENPLPSAEADAEVFVTTARYLAPLTAGSWLHVPISAAGTIDSVGSLAGMPVIRAHAPLKPAVLRHFCCGLTLPFRTEFRLADLVYTRNLWIAWMAVLFGQRVMFDHYRPWPDQIPPLQFWLYRLFCHPRFLVNICHSDYTRGKYLALGIPGEKLRRVHNGFEPDRLQAQIPISEAKLKIGVPADRKTVVYTGRVNHKKGLPLVIAAAKALPEIAFILVGSYGEGPIEALAKDVTNVTIVPWQPAERLADYVFAADILMIPPSWQPLAKYGSTVLPLKLFFYLASGRPILAGRTPDVMEVLEHDRNAYLCRPDDLESLIDGLSRLAGDAELAARLAATAQSDSRDFTWSARAGTIADIAEDRLRATSSGLGLWGRTQSRNWLRQSKRWFVHLIRERSFVLPPTMALPAAIPAPADRD